jgi:hypothetical protein
MKHVFFSIVCILGIVDRHSGRGHEPHFPAAFISLPHLNFLERWRLFDIEHFRKRRVGRVVSEMV